jgi:hypothetical protein
MAQDKASANTATLTGTNGSDNFYFDGPLKNVQPLTVTGGITTTPTSIDGRRLFHRLCDRRPRRQCRVPNSGNVNNALTAPKIAVAPF